MSPSPSPTEAYPWVEILAEVEDYRFGNLFRIVRATLKHKLLNGEMSEPITRINFERGDSAGVLLYDPQNDHVILVKQFRYPIYASLSPEGKQGEKARAAWLLEIVAGVQDEDHTIQEVANKELLEEAGYRINGSLRQIAKIYPSPGGSSERITLFLGEVDASERESKGGGVHEEGEDIEVVSMPFSEAMSMIMNGEIRDAKSIVALQHLALQKTKKLP